MNYIAEIISANGAEVLNDIANWLPVILPSIVTAVVFIASGLFVWRLIRRQRKLKYSITLVSLKDNKLPWLIADAVIGIVILICIYRLIAPPDTLLDTMLKYYNLGSGSARAVVACAALIAISAEAVTASLTASHTAVVDRGVYTLTGFMEWYRVYDYYVDPDKKYVMLSTSKNGPLTLKGTTPPLRFRTEDLDKLKFILNKNKNKFISRSEQ
jgi:hypothetical protein